MNRCNVKERDQNIVVGNVKLRGFQRTYVRRVRLIQQHAARVLALKAVSNGCLGSRPLLGAASPRAEDAGRKAGNSQRCLDAEFYFYAVNVFDTDLSF